MQIRYQVRPLTSSTPVLTSDPITGRAEVQLPVIPSTSSNIHQNSNELRDQAFAHPTQEEINYFKHCDERVAGGSRFFGLGMEHERFSRIRVGDDYSSEHLQNLIQQNDTLANRGTSISRAQKRLNSIHLYCNLFENDLAANKENLFQGIRQEYQALTQGGNALINRAYPQREARLQAYQEIYNALRISSHGFEQGHEFYRTIKDLEGRMLDLMEELNIQNQNDNPLYLIYLYVKLNQAVSTQNLLLEGQRSREFLSWFESHSNLWFDQHAPTNCSENFTAQLARNLRNFPVSHSEFGPTQNENSAALFLPSLREMAVDGLAQNSAIAVNNASLQILEGLLIPYAIRQGVIQNPDQIRNLIDVSNGLIRQNPALSLREILLKISQGQSDGTSAERTLFLTLYRHTAELANLALSNDPFWQNLSHGVFAANEQNQPLYKIRTEIQQQNPSRIKLIAEGLGVNAYILANHSELHNQDSQIFSCDPEHLRWMTTGIAQEIALRHYSGQEIPAWIVASNPELRESIQRIHSTLGHSQTDPEDLARQVTSDAFDLLNQQASNSTQKTLLRNMLYFLNETNFYSYLPYSRDLVTKQNNLWNQSDPASHSEGILERVLSRGNLISLGISGLIPQVVEHGLQLLTHSLLPQGMGLALHLGASLFSSGLSATLNSQIQNHWARDLRPSAEDQQHSLAMNWAGLALNYTVSSVFRSNTPLFLRYALSMAANLVFTNITHYAANGECLSFEQNIEFSLSCGISMFVQDLFCYGRLSLARRVFNQNPQSNSWLVRGMFNRNYLESMRANVANSFLPTMELRGAPFNPFAAPTSLARTQASGVPWIIKHWNS